MKQFRSCSVDRVDSSSTYTFSKGIQLHNKIARQSEPDGWMIAHGEWIKCKITLQQHAVRANNNRIPAYDLTRNTLHQKEKNPQWQDYMERVSNSICCEKKKILFSISMLSHITAGDAYIHKKDVLFFLNLMDTYVRFFPLTSLFSMKTYTFNSIRVYVI